MLSKTSNIKILKFNNFEFLSAWKEFFLDG